MSKLVKAFAPASVAILGASDNPHKAGGRPIAFLKRYGFAGRIYPVNPARAQVQRLRAYAALAALPEVPELVIVAVGGAAGLAMVEACAAAGVAVVVVVASGFAESGSEGRILQQRMVAACRAAGTRLVGPNCQGLANFANGTIANFATIFHEQPGRDGPLAIVGQSGAATQSVYTLAHSRGIFSRYVHATGNEADVTAVELLREIVEDEDIRAAILYLESIADPELLAEAAARASERGVPVIAIKGGRSASGQRAASSHTGAMATEDRIVDAFFAKHDIIRAVDPYEAVSVAALCVGAHMPRGRNLVAMSSSGASCVMAADTADELDLPLLTLDGEAARSLEEVLPGFSSAANPVDLTGAMLTDRNLFPGALDALARANSLHLLMFSLPVAGAGYDVDGYAKALAAFAAGNDVTVAVAAHQASVRESFDGHGLVTYEREREALQALNVVANYALRRQRNRRAPQAGGPRATPPAPAAPSESTGPAMLDEARSLGLLGSAGLQTVRFALCRTPDEAVAAWRNIGAAVVLKGCSPDILHKSEHDLVALDLSEESQVREQAERLEAGVRRLGARYSGVLVASMLRGGRELALGARVDPVFGPVVLVGDGGVYLEALQDFRLLVPPFGEWEVADALARLRIAPILAGLRGEPPADTEAFCRMAVNLGNAILEWRERVASIDINPVKVFAEGQGAVAVDAVVELARP